MLQNNIDIGGNDYLWHNKPQLPVANEENLKLDETVKDDCLFKHPQKFFILFKCIFHFLK